ncbi:hypothetical protein [Coraliomargarita parva]|uniref:hypothetical protein n=1 Tax=Coraliomargarita parva TaxID=3014050 RepID=UPI0022B30A9F|nr:hypothetical protein [Coraliomargarita parva]
MNTPNRPDPLDQKINSLLSSKPLRPSEGFADRVLAAADGCTQVRRTRSLRAWIWGTTAPLAAAIALGFSFLIFKQPAPITSPGPATVQTETDATVYTPTLEEAFLLDEGLQGLSEIDTEQISANGLLATFDALYYDLQS